MAVNIGLYFLHKEHPVCWVSHSAGQVDIINKILQKAKRRIDKFLPEKSQTFEASASLYGSEIPKPDIILESSKESLEQKRSIFSSLAHIIDDRTLLFSNSSSLLPEKIHCRCLGTHFFFPVELTGIVELIACSAAEQPQYNQSLAFLRQSGFDVIEQDDRSAFITNRLLLPLQTAAMTALRDGYCDKDIDTISKSELISFGQLSLMDSIGLDIVRSSAINYKTLESTVLNPDIDLLISCLDRLIKSGKLGKKNCNGLLTGTPLPWTGTEKSNKLLHSLSKQFKQLMKKGCFDALEKELITKEGLSMVLNRIFHATNIPDNLFNI